METPPPTDTKTNVYRELELFVAASLQGDPEIAGQASRCRETGDEGGVTKARSKRAFLQQQWCFMILSSSDLPHDFAVKGALNGLASVESCQND